MPKRNIYLRTAVLMLIACVATSGVFFVSGTSAKFIAGASLNASATVALFNVQIKDSVSGVGGNGDFVDFDRVDAGAMTAITLFTDFGKGRAKIYCTDPWGTPECHVKPGACLHVPGPCETWCKTPCAVHAACPGNVDVALGDLIAPGTMGCMEFTFKNLSEVSVKFYIDQAAFQGIPTAKLTFYGTDQAGLPAENDGDFAGADALSAFLKGGAKEVSVTIHPDGNDQTIYLWWCWPFYRGATQDKADTDLGEDAQTAPVPCTATFTVKAEQVD